MPNIKDITALVKSDFEATNQVIISQLHSEVVLVNQVGHYIVGAGGKRLRPLLVLMMANALGCQSNEHHKTAAIIEFIHTATLLHDDVVDESHKRRGRDTANALFGNAASVLVGDFLYSRAFQMMVELDKMPIMQILANTTNQIAEGEVLQLMHCNNPDTTESDYFQVIRYKTAILFAAACQLGAIIAGKEGIAKDMHDYGLHLGLAFQLMDDALDYTADSEALGKNVGDDLAEGKPTLPLIYAKLNANSDDQKLIHSCIQHGGIEHLDEITRLIQTSGAIEYTLEKAKNEVSLAKSKLLSLPDNLFTRALFDLADLAITRTN